jgi:hypothetical protein
VGAGDGRVFMKRLGRDLGDLVGRHRRPSRERVRWLQESSPNQPLGFDTSRRGPRSPSARTGLTVTVRAVPC